MQCGHVRNKQKEIQKIKLVENISNSKDFWQEKNLSLPV